MDHMHEIDGARAEGQPTPEVIHEIYPNGVQVVMRPNPFAPAVAIQAWVGVGSLNEGPHEHGFAHFLEHMLFKGTTRRGVGEIGAVVEGSGGEINAYTTFDQTVFHLTMASPHAGIGVDLLCDAFANSTLDPEEFDREREVILEEIRRAQDSPGARIGRRVFELAYEGTEAARPIIGTEAEIAGATRESLVAFYRRWYVPSNVTVVVAGDFDPQAMDAQIRNYFGALPRGIHPAPVPALAALAARTGGSTEPRVAILKGDFRQPRLEIAFVAPPLEHFDTAALDLAAFALGSGELARLTRRLRDEQQSVGSVAASLYSPLFGGVFELSALPTDGNLLGAATGMGRELQRLNGAEPVTEAELARARANVRAERLCQEETVDGQARGLGFGMRTPQRYLHDDIYIAMLTHMPAAAVHAAVRRWLRPEAAILVALVPLASEIDEHQLRQAWAAGIKQPDLAPVAPAAAIVRHAPPEAAGFVTRVDPGLTLIVRQNPSVELFTLTAATEGGQRGESSATAGWSHAIAGMLATATRQRTYTQLLSAVEGMGASLEGFSGKDSIGFHLQGLTEQARFLLRLLTECLIEPVFGDEPWQSLRLEIAQGLASQDDSPSNMAIRRFRELIFGDHPYRYSILGTKDALASMSQDVLAEHWQASRPRGPWVVAVTTTLPTEVVTAWVTEAMADLKPDGARRRFASDAMVRTPLGPRAPDWLAKDREQAHVVTGFPGLTWGDPDRAALDVLVSVLGGHGGRLFRELRDRDSLAYTVTPLIAHGCHPGLVGAYIACAPAKAERALAALKEHLNRVVHEEPSPAELVRAKAHITGSHDLGLQRSDAQTSTMALMELYGHGFDDFVRYPKAVAAVDGAAVRRVAQRLFRPEWAADVVVGPKL